MIYECFYFWDELDLLDLKLHELDGYVDKFVLIEFPTSLRHTPQPLLYDQNKDRFSDFHDKIIHIIGEDHDKNTMGIGLYGARKENYTRAFGNCKPNDIIISSDADACLKHEAVEQIEKSNMENNETQILMDWYCYYMDFLYGGAKFGFNGANYFKNIISGGWSSVFRWKPVGTQAFNAGYHFSKLGGTERILNNLQGYPHLEMNNEYTNNIEIMRMKIENGYAWDARGNYKKVMTWVPYKPENYPQYINEHMDIYGKYFRNRE